MTVVAIGRERRRWFIRQRRSQTDATVRCIGGQILPAIGFKDGFIELVVDLLEQGDEALVVDLLFLGGEWFSAAEFFEDVIHACEREAGMQLLLALAVRVQTLAEIADALLERGFFEGGEWERFEAGGICYSGSKAR